MLLSGILSRPWSPLSSLPPEVELPLPLLLEFIPVVSPLELAELAAGSPVLLFAVCSEDPPGVMVWANASVEVSARIETSPHFKSFMERSCYCLLTTSGAEVGSKSYPQMNGLPPVTATVAPDMKLEAGSASITPRSVRYRRLAMVESDPAKANLLYQIADEADRGVLVTTEGLYTRHIAVNEIERAKENPPA